ncbi:MAG: hypothetical protein IT305_18270 [Chloroflexi bacterium]|nr:hypothetical protein [Chloroflexota bacterium]
MLERWTQLRNIDIVTQTYARTQFDSLMPVVDQNRWLDDLRWVDGAGTRAVKVAERGRTAHKLRRLQRSPHAEAVVRIARRYVRLGIPAIRRGEQRFWTLTCMPGPAWIYSRVSINGQEVMTLHTEGAGTLACSLHLARLRLRDRLRLQAVGMLRHGGGIWTSNHRYAPGGEDQLNLIASGESAMAAVLADRAVRAAIRRFNLRLMRRGPSLNAKSHCIDLTSLVLDEPIVSGLNGTACNRSAPDPCSTG